MAFAIWALLLFAWSAPQQHVVGFSCATDRSFRRAPPKTALFVSGVAVDEARPVQFDDEIFIHLCNMVCQNQDDNNNPLRLSQGMDDAASERGVFVTQDVEQGDIILSVPFSCCLRDDRPPDWLLDDSSLEDGDNSDSEYASAASGHHDWATRLAASVIDGQLRRDAASAGDDITSKARNLWFSLLPEPSYLRASLPIHWPEEVLAKAQCTSLELAVDSAFFSRATAAQDLLDSMDNLPVAQSLDLEERKAMISNALDLVQTRSCRVEPKGANNGGAVRLLAPVFDLINHGDSGSVNSEFVVDEATAGEPCLIVRALQDIEANEQVLIDYGSSARPDWRCMCSYGFVPLFQPGFPSEDGDHTAEVFLEGQRFEVGPDSVSEDLVHAMAFAIGEAEEFEQRVVLKPRIALRLAQRLAEAAFQILLTNDDGEDGTGADGYVDVKSKEETAETIISERLAASLRWNQHRILMACSLGLRDWAAKQG